MWKELRGEEMDSAKDGVDILENLEIHQSNITEWQLALEFTVLKVDILCGAF